MNDQFPDATPEELNTTDAICIICREEMTTAKKLICGHLFHVHCLCSWLERQHTCPTCRALVVPPESGTRVTRGPNASRSEAHQGTGISGSSPQGSANSVAGENVSRHQARLQAAATAASIYERSYVYPSPNTVVWCPGSTAAFLPQTQIPLARSSSVSESSGEQASSAQAQQFVPFGELANLSTCWQRLESDPSLWEAQRKIIQHQMEILQHQLQLLRNPKADEGIDTRARVSFGSHKETNVACLRL